MKSRSANQLLLLLQNRAKIWTVVEDSTGSTYNYGDYTNNNAFFWSSIDLSAYAGTDVGSTPYWIRVVDVAGKVATGYLAGVGAGETLGSAIAEDTCSADNTGNWGHDTDATLVFDTDHYNYSNTSYGHAIWIPNKNVVQGQLYKESVDTKDGTYSTMPIYTRFFILDPIVDVLSLSLGNTAAGWITHSAYPNAKVSSNTFQIGLRANTLNGNNVQLKNFSFRRVTDPSSTAVHIVSSLNGTTRAWESIESGLDPNTITSWEIYG